MSERRTGDCGRSGREDRRSRVGEGEWQRVEAGRGVDRDGGGMGKIR